MIFETPRLYTRPWQASDIDAAIQLWGDPKVTALISAKGQLSNEDANEKLDEQINIQQQYDLSYWALVLKETDAIIGCCGIRPLYNDAQKREIGFHLMHQYWGHGYATEAALGSIDYAFNYRHIPTLYSGHNPNNIASANLLKKLGFIHIGDEFYPPTGMAHPLYRLANQKFSSEKMRYIELRPYDMNWLNQFEEERKKIQDLLEPNVIDIHHIGSTAIPGIHAKPIINMMPVVSDLSQIDQLNSQFEKSGYTCMGEYGIPGRRFYWKRNETETEGYHIHLFENGCNEIERHLAFRDYMRTHQDVAADYSQLKRDLAAQFPNDIVSYVDGKSPFIKAIDIRTGHPK